MSTKTAEDTAAKNRAKNNEIIQSMQAVFGRDEMERDTHQSRVVKWLRDTLQQPIYGDPMMGPSHSDTIVGAQNEGQRQLARQLLFLAEQAEQQTKE